MIQLVFRFVVGGSVVSLFAVIGDVLKPKSFAGLFGAAPSVALATLALTIATDGKTYAAVGSTLDDRRRVRLFRLRLLLHAGYDEARSTRDASHDRWPRCLARLCARRVVCFSEITCDENQSRFFGAEANAMVRICAALLFRRRRHGCDRPDRQALRARVRGIVS